MASLHELTPQYLNTSRLTLQRFNRSAEHYTCLLAAMNSSIAHSRMGDLGIQKPEQFDAFNATARLHDHRFKHGVADDDLLYLIHLGSQSPNNELIGGISIAQRRAGSTLLPADMGWCLLETHMGKGYATEAAREVLRWATEDFGIKQLIVVPSETNRESNRVAEKLGFVAGGQIPDADEPGKMMNVLTLPGMQKVEVKEGLSVRFHGA